MDPKKEKDATASDLNKRVGRYRPIEHYISTYYYPDVMKEFKGDVLREQYRGTRTISGDGNCYYRAVIYGYLERLIIMGERELKDFLKLVEDRDGLFAMGEDAEEISRELVPHVKAIIGRRRGSGLKAALRLLFEKVNDPYVAVDRAMVRLIRRVVYTFCKQNGGLDLGGITLSQLAKACAHINSYDEFMEEFVLKDNADLADPLAKIVPLALRISVAHIIIDPKDREKRVPAIEFKAEIEGFKFELGDSLDLHGEMLCVLFVPGHYQIVYPKLSSDAVAEYDIEPEKSPSPKKEEFKKPEEKNKTTPKAEISPKSLGPTPTTGQGSSTALSYAQKAAPQPIAAGFMPQEDSLPPPVPKKRESTLWGVLTLCRLFFSLVIWLVNFVLLLLPATRNKKSTERARKVIFTLIISATFCISAVFTLHLKVFRACPRGIALED